MLTEPCVVFFSPFRAVLSAILRDEYLTSAVFSSNRRGPFVGLWHQETEAVRVTGTHVVLTGRTSQRLSRASLLTTVFDP